METGITQADSARLTLQRLQQASMSYISIIGYCLCNSYKSIFDLLIILTYISLYPGIRFKKTTTLYPIAISFFRLFPCAQHCDNIVAKSQDTFLGGVVQGETAFRVISVAPPLGSKAAVHFSNEFITIRFLGEAPPSQDSRQS